MTFFRKAVCGPSNHQVELHVCSLRLPGPTSQLSGKRSDVLISMDVFISMSFSYWFKIRRSQSWKNLFIILSSINLYMSSKTYHFQVHKNYIGLFKFLKEKNEVHSPAEIWKCYRVKEILRIALERWYCWHVSSWLCHQRKARWPASLREQQSLQGP